MKTLLLFISFFASALFSSAQINSTTPWTWMKGDNTTDQLGVYGTQGVAANSNKPGARNYATTWRDSNGNLWLLGGIGYESSNIGHLNDLWKYNTSSNVWTWMKGDSIIAQKGIYGTQGIGENDNKPGATYASVSWTDTNGNLWLFGGFGYANSDEVGFLNALWKYVPATNQWVWVKGDNTINQHGVYGTQGTELSVNNPGGRYGSTTWIDNNGNLWLFGGFGYDNNSFGILNDLWKYNPETNIWTWMKGDKTIEHSGTYGSIGVAKNNNNPGSRFISSSWTDINGNFWLFGGYGIDENNATGNLNDLWKFNPVTNEWAWMKGDTVVDQPGIYGTRGISNSSNKPGARYFSTSWADTNGDMWLFGGSGYDGTSSGYLNDLWKYSSVTNNWTWIKGDNTIDQMGVYGTQGMSSPLNKSGSRTGSVSWTDGTGNLWLFGGYGYDGNTSGNLNDLWKISNLQAILPLHLLFFNGVFNNETVKLQWTTEQETNFSHFNVQRSFDGINFSSIAKINGSGNSNKNDYSYLDKDLKNAQRVFYRLQLMDQDGSFTYSKVLLFNLNHSNIIDVFPNPAVQSINVSFDQNKSGKVIISFIDMNGSLVKKQTENISLGRASFTTDVSMFPSGTYLLSISNENGNFLKQKFIKQ